MIINLLQDLNFWSALSGFIGTVLIFYFGFPPKLNRDGHINLILEQENQSEQKRAKKYVFISYVGLVLISVSYFIQLVKVVNS